MVFILVDERTNKVLTGIMGDGMYYSMEDGDIPMHSLIFDNETYTDMMIYEPRVYDECSGLEIELKELTKVEIKRK